MYINSSFVGFLLATCGPSAFVTVGRGPNVWFILSFWVSLRSFYGHVTACTCVISIVLKSPFLIDASIIQFLTSSKFSLINSSFPTSKSSNKWYSSHGVVSVLILFDAISIDSSCSWGTCISDPLVAPGATKNLNMLSSSLKNYAMSLVGPRLVTTFLLVHLRALC